MNNNIPNITYNTYDVINRENKTDNNFIKFLNNINEFEGVKIISELEIKSFSKILDNKGFSKFIESNPDNLNIYYFPKSMTTDLEMKKHLDLDEDKLKKIMDIKLDVFRGNISVKDAKKLVDKTFEVVTVEEFAYGEQQLLSFGITDEIIADGMDDILDVFDNVLERKDLNLEPGHPIHTYYLECKFLESLVAKMQKALERKFIKNEWLEFYDKLYEINTHFSRKQNQLFSALERKGFDRPSKIMWTFDNNVRDKIKEARLLLEADKDQEFIDIQPQVYEMVLDILSKEKDVLFPTSIKLLSKKDFSEMRISDDEIGYCLIPEPKRWGGIANTKINKPTDNNLLKDLGKLLAKHGIAQSSKNEENEMLDVSMGKLTLKQINLIFKHMQVDLSYVDENDIMRFYSDTKHRVFPRSAGVIGREVQNCHPRESVATVERIIEAFRNGEKDEAEFWIQMGDKFIYIIYNAVRDSDGTFRGVLEMMQDATHIRSLTGDQRLLSWDEEPSSEKNKKNSYSEPKIKKTTSDFDEKTTVGALVKKYPFLKKTIPTLSPKFGKLSNPIIFNMMKDVATLDMISSRGGFTFSEFEILLRKEIKKHSTKSN